MADINDENAKIDTGIAIHNMESSPELVAMIEKLTFKIFTTDNGKQRLTI